MKLYEKANLWILLICIISALNTTAQRSGERLRAMKLQNLSGIEFAKEACRIAEISLKNNQYDRSIHISKKAYEEAEKENSKEWMGVSLMISSAARYLKNKESSNSLAEKDNIEKDLKHSAELLQGTASAFRIAMINDWIKNIEDGTLPQKPKGKFKDLVQLKRKIENKGIENLSEEDIKKLKPGARLALEKMISAKTSDEVTQKQVDDSKEKLLNTKAFTSIELKNLESELNKQRKLVEGLNADQVRAELLLSRQKSVLDSMIYTSVLDSVKLVNQEAALDQQSTQLAYQQSQRNLAFAGGGLVALLALGLWFRFKSEKKYSKDLQGKNNIIENEKAKSESLLLNILPKAIAEELKLNGVAKTRNYENVTVLFTDFVNFTSISEKLSPEELVENLDYCFKSFDSIVRKYGVEKIKTIGDAYMAAGGIPDPDHDHPLKIIQAAKEMCSFLEQWKEEKLKEGKPYFEARIGLHSGPVTAGIVGMDKFAYDIWGDTVNVASRIESSSQAGKINISESLYDLVKDDFTCISRGNIHAKNKGEIKMYFVE